MFRAWELDWCFEEFYTIDIRVKTGTSTRSGVWRVSGISYRGRNSQNKALGSFKILVIIKNPKE